MLTIHHGMAIEEERNAEEFPPFLPENRNCKLKEKKQEKQYLTITLFW